MSARRAAIAQSAIASLSFCWAIVRRFAGEFVREAAAKLAS
jgi:hypothetical protein